MLSVLGGNVFIQPAFDPTLSEGGIHLLENYQERVDQGIVKYCGPMVQYVQPGDWVFFPGYSGYNYFSEDEGHLIRVHERSIECVLHEVATEVSGLYLRDKKGEYFPATYEATIRLIRDALRNKNEKERLVMGKAKMKYNAPPDNFYPGEWNDLDKYRD